MQPLLSCCLAICLFFHDLFLSDQLHCARLVATFALAELQCVLQVDPAASKYELLKSKTEIQLKKSGAIRWPTLETSNEKADPYAPAPTAAAAPPPVQQPKPSYPSSANRKVVDWYVASHLL